MQRQIERGSSDLDSLTTRYGLANGSPNGVSASTAVLSTFTRNLRNGLANDLANESNLRSREHIPKKCSCLAKDCDSCCPAGFSSPKSLFNSLVATAVARAQA